VVSKIGQYGEHPAVLFIVGDRPDRPDPDSSSGIGIAYYAWRRSSAVSWCAVRREAGVLRLGVEGINVLPRTQAGCSVEETADLWGGDSNG
jgi:hypothetical protein